MLPDIEIAQSAKMLPINEIADGLGIVSQAVECYGRYKAKIDPAGVGGGRRGKLVLVTAITPTPAGEGKTTTTIGLVDAMNRLGMRAVAALREPSLGPVFGVKGGAAGGGYAQVVPMEDINLHFTGDFHAISAANNLLAAMLDNHIHQGNALGIDTRRVVWKRCIDMNDRQLRHITSGLGGRTDGVPREDGFDITAASEVMATLCLSRDAADLKNRLARLIVGYRRDDTPVCARDINAQGAMTALLRDAIKPNLVQTLEHSPVLIHAGPFANIAHGCNSIIATETALALSDYAVTEAGFGADLGAEKFFDIKCRAGGFRPDAAVIVATVRALKYHGGADKRDLSKENVDLVKAGIGNLKRHVRNMQDVFGMNCVVAINRFPTDTDAELDAVIEAAKELGVKAVVSDVFSKGGEGGLELAREVARIANEGNDFRFAYGLDGGIADKIEAIAKKVYRADGVKLSPAAIKQSKTLEALGFGNLPVCIAKTQYSFSNEPSLRGAPEGFQISVNSLRASAGAGFVVALTGDMATMPGLSKVPAAESIDVDDSGRITGLF